MPHVNIKHFPALSPEQQHELGIAITQVITHIVKCDEKAVSVALEPIHKELWNEKVYIPEIIKRKELLCKLPGY